MKKLTEVIKVFPCMLLFTLFIIMLFSYGGGAKIFTNDSISVVNSAVFTDVAIGENVSLNSDLRNSIILS